MSEGLVALPLTKTHGVPGEFMLRSWAGLERPTPACTLHGAMLRVSPDRYWYRCATCNIGCEDTVGRTRAAVATTSEPNQVGWWCTKTQFLYWRGGLKPPAQTNPHEGHTGDCCQPVYLAAVKTS